MQPLARLLVGDDATILEIPTLPELITAAISLAAGRRRKVLLPLGRTPAEFALVRQGPAVLVSCYETGSSPEVLVLDRRIPLRRLLDACVQVAERAIPGPASSRDVTTRLADRARHAAVEPDPSGVMTPTERRGGALENPGDDVPLGFGFAARIPPGVGAVNGSSARADVHALLFPGELWAWIRGRRMVLDRGPIMLAIQKMISAVRSLIEAEEAGRTANVRLRTRGFRIGTRLDRMGNVALTIGGQGQTAVTITALDVPGAALPILRLATDSLRALVAADRAQSRNLRVRAMRDEVRALRRLVKSRDRNDGFINRDPDRLRVSAPAEPDQAISTATRPQTAAGRLRFSERWRVELDELDASSTFLCGDRIVVATPRSALALCRDQGQVLWAREGLGGPCMMAGQTLLRTSPEGDVELCDVSDGEAYATSRITPRPGGAFCGAHVGGGSLPPLAVLAEGKSRLVAIDLRNGEPQWGFSARGPGAFRLKRTGRVLLVVSGDGSINALDAASGEVAWRVSERTRFHLEPVVSGDVVVVAGGEPGGSSGRLYGIDLYSGELLWQRELPTAPAAAPVKAGHVVSVAMGGRRRGSLATYDPTGGSPLWTVPDPGVGVGGACMALDRSLLVNAPAGRITALDLETGDVRWTGHLSDPVADDVPRRLEPILRGGALFVPAASVHVLRPGDGSPLGTALPCDLVPDLIRVDERGWVYVAEDSGNLTAYAPVPHLSLVKR